MKTREEMMAEYYRENKQGESLALKNILENIRQSIISGKESITCKIESVINVAALKNAGYLLEMIIANSPRQRHYSTEYKVSWIWEDHINSDGPHIFGSSWMTRNQDGILPETEIHSERMELENPICKEDYDMLAEENKNMAEYLFKIGINSNTIANICSGWTKL